MHGHQASAAQVTVDRSSPPALTPLTLDLGDYCNLPHTEQEVLGVVVVREKSIQIQNPGF